MKPLPAGQLDLVVPGDPATLTGGYIYDRRILDALEQTGWSTCVHALDPSFPRPTAAAVADARAVLAGIPDGRIVVLDGLALGGLAPLLEREAGRLRLVALVHHPLCDETGLAPAERDHLRSAERDALAHIGHIVVTSRWTAARLEGLGITASDRVTVVRPGVERPSFRAGEAGLASSHEEALRLLSVGTLTPRKGYPLLLEALAPLRRHAWRLDCVGSTERDPAEAENVRRTVAQLGLDERVTLHGEVEPAELERLYHAADAFVFASHLEGYGMACADALAHGLPVVGTAAGAVPDTVAADAALLVPPGDAAALGRALETLLGDPALRRRMAGASRAAGLELPSWTEAGRRFAAAVGGRRDAATLA